ncbi:uncharacterized protein LOC129919993 [Episyrphus balteatus]|uniref:uncharacterized protein LOC129919993 n=1 Tax=Episyrphus balteatus TaxID=286459 RepID=UPI002484DF7D|nr:uncharacterized protein LOC129919993 [Episyrphus balteatus]
MSLSQTNLQQLHTDIINYLTKRSRIMSCHKLHTWNEFTTQYHNQYSDFTREDLRREFLQTILPKVFSYHLTSIQRRKIEIYSTHNGFTKTDNGFQEQPSLTHLPKEGIHFCTSKEEAQIKGLACVLEEPASIPTSDQKIRAWLSAVNSTEDELALNRLLPEQELRTRLTQSHIDFKTTANYPPNLTPTIAQKIIAYRTECQELSSRFNKS